jgi:hypothetical protein
LVGGAASNTSAMTISEAVHGTLPSCDASSKHGLGSPPTTPKKIRQITALLRKKKKKKKKKEKKKKKKKKNKRKKKVRQKE